MADYGQLAANSNANSCTLRCVDVWPHGSHPESRTLLPGEVFGSGQICLTDRACGWAGGGVGAGRWALANSSHRLVNQMVFSTLVLDIYKYMKVYIDQ